MVARPLIGIVGGMGPYAGLDLARKICAETSASSDQDHLSVALLSLPGEIPDRTAFIIGEAKVNPAHAILDVVVALERLGCRAVGIPCHSAHVPQVLEPVVKGLSNHGSDVQLVNIVEETVRFVSAAHPGARRIGVLSTSGTYRSGIYLEALAAAGLETITLDEQSQEELVHAAVYDPGYGIKARAHPVSARARRDLRRAIIMLRDAGAQVIVLGCTELPLALLETEVNGVPIVDPTRVLARALIHAVAPDRLRPEPRPNRS